MVNYPSVIEQLRKKQYTDRDLHVDVLRLDQLHPVVSGNKWFKLKGHLHNAMLTPGTPILTFGGAWSNHLVATAFAAQQLGLAAVGVIRGEQPATLSATLTDAAAYGMSLSYISREAYSRKDQPAFLQQLNDQYPGAYIIPEGGGGEAGIRGSGNSPGHR
ncbi:hypothetical protein ACQ86N_09870 [Puia sp. P3]|uniref:hypothetical protein n=1 Tax=Puia sp. P3 TaxID=3423952 RepID=UPI003D67474C